MPITVQGDQPPLDMFIAGTSYTFENKRGIESFHMVCSAAVTVDLGSRLFREILEWTSSLSKPLSIQVLETQDWERIIEKLDALEAVSGMLNELTDEQIEIFETSVKRRALFQ